VYNATPERKRKSKERWVKPEVKKVQKKYRASPQGKAKMKEYYTSDKVKTKKIDNYAKFDKKSKIIIGRGKLECACCGNKNFKWLQIDHILPQGEKNQDNVGKLRREIAQGIRPDSEFQLLCANCNFAKRNHKTCPIDHSLDWILIFNTLKFVVSITPPILVVINYLKYHLRLCISSFSV